MQPLTQASQLMEPSREWHGDGFLGGYARANVWPRLCTEHWRLFRGRRKLWLDLEGHACLIPDSCDSVSTELSLRRLHMPFSSFLHTMWYVPLWLSVSLIQCVCVLPPVITAAPLFSLFGGDVWVILLEVVSLFSFSLPELLENKVIILTM